jgi:adenine-specific DNA-methyltransferase
MPTLDWIGKRAVLNHHREIPYRLLRCDPKLSAGDPGSGNLLVQGDNLVALKALLPYYAGQVKCIYIDPPYNTGNEGWVYNDAVNSPEIREWLNKQVKGEDEDLTRHDKWLCMMFPRLKLLSEFLQNDGIIIVSIDDFEAYRLRSLMDEVFGPRNFIAQLVWDKTRKNDAKLFSVGHEYLIVYAKSLPRLRQLKTVWREQKPGATAILAKWQELKAEHGDDFAVIQEKLREWYKSLPAGNPSKKLSRYKWVDKWGPWRDRDISWPGGGGPRYDVPHPDTQLPCFVPERGWGFATSEVMQHQIDLGLVQFRKDHTQPPFRKAHLIPVPEELEANQADAVENDDADLEEDVQSEDVGLQVMPSVIYKQAQVSVKLLRKLFDGRKVFPNPKDHEILMRLIRYVTGPDDLILDAFAGSGSTAHAILQINKEDASNRRFILIEMDQKIATEITSERIRRVMAGHAGLPALGGSFRYCTLAEELFDSNGQVSEKVKFPALAQHVYFTETGEPLTAAANGKRSAFIGTCNGTAYYLLFNGILGDRRPDGGNILTSAVLRELPPHDGPRVVFGEGCRLGSDRLKRERITFKQIPYEIKVS